MDPFCNLSTGEAEHRIGGVIKDEHKGLHSNAPGTISMANIGKPHTGGSQVFFNVAHNYNLDWFTPGESKHPVFGIIRKGLDVIMNVSKVQVGMEDRPVQPIKMIKVTVTGAPEVTITKPAESRRGRSRSSSSSSSSTSSRARAKKNAKLLRQLDKLDQSGDKPKQKKRKRSSSSSSSSRQRKKKKGRR